MAMPDRDVDPAIPISPSEPPDTHDVVGTPPPFIALHTTVVLVVAILIALTIGGLTFLTTGSVPGAMLAGLTAGGTSVHRLRSLIS
jgi:hypothetical protein